jgi:hypothetical protein
VCYNTCSGSCIVHKAILQSSYVKIQKYEKALNIEGRRDRPIDRPVGRHVAFHFSRLFQNVKSYAVWAATLFFFWRRGPMGPMVSSFTRSLDHTQRRTTVSRTPLDEWSARRSDFWQHTTLITQRHSCPRRDSNPQSQQASGLLFTVGIQTSNMYCTYGKGVSVCPVQTGYETFGREKIRLIRTVPSTAA